MNPLVAVLATAAVAAGSVKAIQEVRKRLRDAPDHIKWLKKRRSSREDGVVVDLEPDQTTGVYTLKTER
ncbi:MAG: hypothetical protein AAGH41_01945 [Pseudomonadota bacterium]